MPRYELTIAPVPSRAAFNPFTRQPLSSPGRPAVRLFAEVEQLGARLLSCQGRTDAAARRIDRTYRDEVQADEARVKMVARWLRRGFIEVGPCIELAADLDLPEAPRVPGSALLLDARFEAGDDRFLDEVFSLHQPDKLASIAERWYTDRRPPMRQALLAYIDDGCDRAGHKALVKRLFKLAEAAQDDEAIGHFMVAFDALGTRRLLRRSQWDRSAGQVRAILELRSDPTLSSRVPPKTTTARFSRRTRAYLARRAFRYMRRLGFRNPARYAAAMQAALPLYQDRALCTPARLLDAWALLHALYGHSPVLKDGRLGMLVVRGRSLSELQPAPYFPDTWKGVFAPLLEMLSHAGSRTVRNWCVDMLHGLYAEELDGIHVSVVQPLLGSPHAEVRAFALQLIGKAQGLPSLSVKQWLDLLRTEHPEVASAVCDLVLQYVEPARLTLAHCVSLGLSRIAPVADLGVTWARDKTVVSSDDLRAVLALAGGSVASAREASASWIAELIGSLPTAGPEHLRELIDIRYNDARAHGLRCLDATERFRKDPTLWFALAESPYDDVRAFVVSRAAAWEKDAWPATLQWLWQGILLSVRRGSRLKQQIPRQIALRLVEHPDEADSLLPLLGHALRSVRLPERAAALGALARAANGRPELRASVTRHLPEIVLGTEVSS